MKKIGFVGLGIMGKPMAKCLLKGGCRLMVNDLDSRAVNELVTLGAISGSLSEIGEQCEVIFTILPNGNYPTDDAQMAGGAGCATTCRAVAAPVSGCCRRHS